MVEFNLIVHENDFDGETIYSYELFIELDKDYAGFRIIMAKSEFETLKKVLKKEVK